MPRKKNSYQLERKLTQSERDAEVLNRKREKIGYIDEDAVYQPKFKELMKLVPIDQNRYN